MSWNKTLPLPHPAVIAGASGAPGGAAPDTVVGAPPSGDPPISATPAEAPEAPGSLPPSIALSAPEFSESPFDAPSAWSSAPLPAAPAYPPLPRPHMPTKTSAQMPPVGPSPFSDTLQMKGPPSGLPTLTGAAVPSTAPAPATAAPAALRPGSLGTPLAPPVPESAPRLTVNALAQTAAVDAPEIGVAQAMPDGALDRAGAPPLPPDAPPWMVTARYLSNHLEAAIARGHADPALQAAAQRALWAFRLSGHPPAQIARVHHLVERAFEALRSTRRADVDGVLRDCSLVVWRSLPGQVRSQISEAQVETIVRLHHTEPDGRRGRGLAVARLLGWPPLPEAWLLDAVDSALRSPA